MKWLITTFLPIIVIPLNGHADLPNRPRVFAYRYPGPKGMLGVYFKLPGRTLGWHEVTGWTLYRRDA